MIPYQTSVRICYQLTLSIQNFFEIDFSRIYPHQNSLRILCLPYPSHMLIQLNRLSFHLTITVFKFEINAFTHYLFASCTLYLIAFQISCDVIQNQTNCRPGFIPL
jgi:hypothetical protein